jgi:hypothetical protein
MGRGEQSDLVVVAQGLDGDLAEFGELADLEHLLWIL